MGTDKNIKLHIVTDIKASHHPKLTSNVIMVAFGDLKSATGLKSLNEHLASRSYIEGYVPSQSDVVTISDLSTVPEESKAFPAATAAACAAKPATADDDDDDFDIFGDDDEDEEETPEEKEKKQKLLDAYHAKKAKKPVLVAKSSLTLDVKPWDDETDMVAIEEHVRSIACDGLLWGASKLVPLAYGIKKLQICAVIEDDKVSTDWLEEEITKAKDFVQSMDIAKFNKI